MLMVVVVRVAVKELKRGRKVSCTSARRSRSGVSMSETGALPLNRSCGTLWPMMDGGV